MPKLNDQFKTGDEITILGGHNALRRSTNFEFSGDDTVTITIKKNPQHEWPPGMYIKYSPSLYSIEPGENHNLAKIKQYIEPDEHSNSISIKLKEKQKIPTEDATVTVGDDGIGEW